MFKGKIEIKYKSNELTIEEKSSGILVYTPSGSSEFAKNLDGALGINSIGIVSIAHADGLLKEFKSLTVPVNLFTEINIYSENMKIIVDSGSEDVYFENIIKIKEAPSLKLIIKENSWLKFLSKV